MILNSSEVTFQNKINEYAIRLFQTEENRALLPFCVGVNIYRNISPDIDPPGSILMYFSILIQSVTSFFASAMI